MGSCLSAPSQPPLKGSFLLWDAHVSQVLPCIHHRQQAHNLFIYLFNWHSTPQRDKLELVNKCWFKLSGDYFKKSDVVRHCMFSSQLAENFVGKGHLCLNEKNLLNFFCHILQFNAKLKLVCNGMNSFILKLRYKNILQAHCEQFRCYSITHFSLQPFWYPHGV